MSLEISTTKSCVCVTVADVCYCFRNTGLTMESHQVNALKQTDDMHAGHVSSERLDVGDVLSDQCEDLVSGICTADVSSEPAATSDAVKRDFDVFCQFAFPAMSDLNGDSSESDSFYFESDHVALKDNDDYRRLLRVFVTLASQRTAALTELDTLLALQQTALRDPVEFVSRLRRGELHAEFPRARSPVQLPNIAWQCYTDNVEAVLASLGRAGHSTRQKQKRELMSGIRDSANTTGTASTANRRVSATFNQPWSTQEQRLLEQLLNKYPPERFEARRFAKIAAELPGRTTQQVTSRVQKYFIKLAKAGLPVPGRTPSLTAHGGRWFSGRLHGHHQQHNHFYFPQSTFLTSFTPPVYMTDDDDDDCDDDDNGGADATQSSSQQMMPAAADVDDVAVDDIPACLHDTDEYRELMTLTALRQSRLSTDQRRPCIGHSVHSGQCGHSVDGHAVLSSDVLRAMSHIDVDYTSPSTGVSSYLDPNYMPAL